MITFSCRASCFMHLPSFIDTFLHPYILHLRKLAPSLARTLPNIFWLLHPSILHLVCLILCFSHPSIFNTQWKSLDCQKMDFHRIERCTKLANLIMFFIQYK